MMFIIPIPPTTTDTDATAASSASIVWVDGFTASAISVGCRRLKIVVAVTDGHDADHRRHPDDNAQNMVSSVRVTLRASAFKARRGINQESHGLSEKRARQAERATPSTRPPGTFGRRESPGLSVITVSARPTASSM